MPATPKSKSPSHVLVWNKGRIDSNSNYRVGVITLHYHHEHGDGRVSPVIHPIRPGLDLVPVEHWARANEDAKRVGADHQITKAKASGRLTVADLHKMPLAQAKEAIEQTASKAVLVALCDGKIVAPDEVRDHALHVRATWGRRDISKVRKVTEHFASFARAEGG